MANLSNINGKFVVEQTTGYVGVGTTDPNFLIEAAGTNSEIALNSTSGSIYRVRSTSSNAFIITKNGVGDRLVIDGAGNSTFAGAVQTTQITATNGLNYLKRNTDASLQLRSENTRSGLFITKPATDTVMGSALVLADESYRLGTANYYHMVMLQNGNTYFNQNVGIGTDSPDNILHIRKGDTTYASQVGADTMLFLETTNISNALQFTSANTGQQYIMFGDDDPNAGWISYNHSDNNLNFRVNGSERMRIDSSGKVKIGQDVGGSAFNGATVLQLSPYTSGQPVYIGLKSDTSNNCGILMGDSDDSYVGGFIYNNSNNYLVINTNNAERMRIDSSGNVDINAGVLNIGASRGTYIDASEDSTATGHIFVSNDAAGDFGQLAGNLILQARIHPTVYRDIIFAGGLNTAEALMTIQGEGNVGIGTTSPSANLHVQDTSTATLKVITTGVADASVNIQGYDAGVHIGDATNGLRWAIWNDGPSTSSSLKFGSYALGTWYNDGSQVVTMKSDGNVGIGTTSPSTKLEVVTTTSSTAIRCNVGQSSDIFLGFTGANPELLLQDNANIVTHRFESNGDNYIVGSNVGIGTTSPSGPFQVKVGTSTPLIVASSSYCNNVGIRTTTPTASLQVKGNVSYSYNNYTNVANTWINVINFSGYPAGLYQISIIKKTNASTYITAIVKWSATAGTVISTIASNQLGITFSGTQLQAISGIATGTLMSANLQCLVTNEDFCS